MLVLELLQDSFYKFQSAVEIVYQIYSYVYYSLLFKYSHVIIPMIVL